MAIIIDEHGGTTGLMTMEDVLKQIVGNIEDEYDEKSDFQTGRNNWRVMRITEIEVLNQELHTNLTHDDYDSLGAWLMAKLGRIPRHDDSIAVQRLNITVVGADENALCDFMYSPKNAAHRRLAPLSKF